MHGCGYCICVPVLCESQEDSWVCDQAFSVYIALQGSGGGVGCGACMIGVVLRPPYRESSRGEGGDGGGTERTVDIRGLHSVGYVHARTKAADRACKRDAAASLRHAKWQTWGIHALEG